MKRLSSAWVAALLWWVPGTVFAQQSDMSFGLDEAESAENSETAPPAEGEGQAEGETGQTNGDEAGQGDVISDLLGSSGTSTDTETRDAAPRQEEVVEEIYAVQQVYALRNNRVEISPSMTATINDQYVSHYAPSIGLNYWFTNVLAIGANFLWYQGLESESDLTYNTRRSTRLAVPITEYQLGAHLNFSYVPLYGKFSVFNELIFQWDMYVLGGVGLMRTRPVPVIDDVVRRFDFDWRVAFNVGIGIRVFVTRWLAVFAELRDYMYLEQLESLQTALGSDQRANPATWYAPGVSFTNNVTAHLGLTIFIPFEFNYRRPR